MKLFEYQAKELLQKAGIEIPKGLVATSVDEVRTAIQQIGLPCVLKAQLLIGGRGKAGLIPFVKTLQEAEREAKRLFTSSYQVKRILVEEAVPFAKETYLSITMEPVHSNALIIASASGGIEIETLAQSEPEKILQEPVDITTGIFDFQAKDLSYNLGCTGETAKKMQKTITALYHVWKTYDAELAEINPLFITKDGNVIAGDAKVLIDENSLFRQSSFQRTREYYDSDIEFEAAQEGIPYLQFDGDISLMCAGAGLATTVFDLIHYEGGSVANYLEFGGPNYRKAVRAMELCLKNKSKAILIVTFGTIARADVMAEGVVEAVQRLKPDRPIITCIRGTNEEEAVRILKEAGLEPLFDTEEAVKKAVAIAKGEVRP